MDYILLILTVIIGLFVKRYFSNSRARNLIEKIPGPKAYPVIGNLFDVNVPTSEVFNQAARLTKKYGPILRLWIGSRPQVTIASPEYIELILGSTKEIRKSFRYQLVQSWLGLGLLTADGSRWFKHRKLITPTFHFAILESFVPVFESNSAVLVDKLRTKAETGEPFDVYNNITLCALDIICETAMGINLNSQSQYGENQHEYITAIYRIANQTSERAKRFFLFNDFVYGLTARGKAYKKNLDIVHGFTAKVIQDRKALRANQVTQSEENVFGGKKRKAFLDHLLDNSKDLTDQDIREEVDTFMFEGHDTTTTGICWTLFLLGHHPDIQDQVADEVRSLWPEGGNLTVSILNEMKYLERVLKESLRIYPSVPFISRELQQDLKIGDFLLPAETAVSLPIILLHRDENSFPDPLKFDPDRFLPENVQKRHPYAYVPFSAGSRNCVGQKFALLEEKVMVASLVRAFKITSLQKKEDVNIVVELVSRPPNGISLKISKRE